MKNKKYVVYGCNFGHLEECIKRKKYHFDDLVELLYFVADNSVVIDGVHSVRFDDLVVRRYCYSFEQKCWIYLVCCTRYFDEVYDTPQAYKYFVDLDDSLRYVGPFHNKSNYVKSSDINDVIKKNKTMR